MLIENVCNTLNLKKKKKNTNQPNIKGFWLLTLEAAYLLFLSFMICPEILVAVIKYRTIFLFLVFCLILLILVYWIMSVA